MIKLITCFSLLMIYFESLACGVTAPTLIKRDPVGWIAKTEVIFVGTVISVKAYDFDRGKREINGAEVITHHQGQLVKYKVMQAYKGVTKPKLKTINGISTSCSWEVNKGETYLVFANTQHEDMLFTSGTAMTFDESTNINEYLQGLIDAK